MARLHSYLNGDNRLLNSFRLLAEFIYWWLSDWRPCFCIGCQRDMVQKKVTFLVVACNSLSFRFLQQCHLLHQDSKETWHLRVSPLGILTWLCQTHLRWCPFLFTQKQLICKLNYICKISSCLIYCLEASHVLPTTMVEESIGSEHPGNFP